MTETGHSYHTVGKLALVSQYIHLIKFPSLSPAAWWRTSQLSTTPKRPSPLPPSTPEQVCEVSGKQPWFSVSQI